MSLWVGLLRHYYYTFVGRQITLVLLPLNEINNITMELHWNSLKSGLKKSFGDNSDVWIQLVRLLDK